MIRRVHSLLLWNDCSCGSDSEVRNERGSQPRCRLSDSLRTKRCVENGGGGCGNYQAGLRMTQYGGPFARMTSAPQGGKRRRRAGEGSVWARQTTLPLRRRALKRPPQSLNICVMDGEVQTRRSSSHSRRCRRGSKAVSSVSGQ